MIELIFYCIFMAIRNQRWFEDTSRLPTFWLFVVSFLFNALIYGYVLYSFQKIYQQQLTDSFVSLEESSGICNAVPKSVSGSFPASYDGYWKSDPQFSYNYSAYVVNLDDYSCKFSVLFTLTYIFAVH